MFDMIPFRKNSLAGREDFFSSFLKNFFDDDYFSVMGGLSESFRVDLKETNDNYLVEADLPGVKKEDINVEFNNYNLIIRAKRDESIEDKKENYVRRERHYGEFNRSFYIDNADETNITASFNAGVLKIAIPKLNKGNDSIRRIDIK